MSTARHHYWIAVLSTVLAWTLCERSCAAESPRTSDAAQAVIHLAGDASLIGELRGSHDAKVLRWQSPHFTRPFDFMLDAVRGVHYPTPPNPLKPVGEYWFELAGGDLLAGSLVGLTDKQIELDSARFGRLRVQRDQIRSMVRLHGADPIYLGPNGLAGWKQQANTKPWREEAGQLVTDELGATLFADLGIPAQAIIEFELSWKASPDFVLTLGVGESATSNSTAPGAAPVPLGMACFDVWTGLLIALRETSREADTAIVQDVGSRPGRTHLVTYIDQDKGRFLVFSPDGKSLADLQIAPKKPQVFGGVRLTNKGGGVRLERLRISRWNGVSPGEVQANKSRMHRTDGSVLYGQLTEVDTKAKQFTVRDGDEVTRVPAEQVASVFFSSPKNQSPPKFRVLYQDGTQLSGELTRIEDDTVQLNSTGIEEPVRLPLSGVRSLVVLKQADSKAPPLSNGPTGRLELDGLRLPGRLTSGRETADASCLVWQPDYSMTDSPLRPGAAGRIVYRAVPPPLPPDRQPQPPQPMQRAGVALRVPNAPTPIQPKSAAPSRDGRRSMHLRNGDTIPCEVNRIDEHGITFKTPLSDATFVAHEKVKAVELVLVTEPFTINRAKRERLLTLPRMLTDSPPTQLIRSRDGDFLRGRLVGLDGDTLRVEVHLETKEIPRDRISHIIWLHADELNKSSAPDAGPRGTATGTRVQVQRADGNRLTCFAEQLDQVTLSGTNDVLGSCRVDLTQVDQLMIGSEIDLAAADLPYHRWKLCRAIEPKYVQAENGDGSSSGTRASGTESPLVGKPAPDFELQLLDGSKFRLSGSMGKIVVLDFWATWCGPCLQSMPQVASVVREFADQDVQLIAVNLEERAGQITSTLERHKLDVTVALDRDGGVAAKYEANAIPQTVIIDRSGNVDRLFVGGGAKLGDQLRDAIQSLISKPSAP
jgi:thiol-disulfide isomerase/thioredoxin